jgi:NADPH-dependent 2,4-dienoyl-CoA reductase/sulfur reductase-like enzyme
MQNYKYLIIGGGMTGDAAAHGIRGVDPVGSIGLITAEAHPPYNRPPLSKALWKGKPLESIWRKNHNQNVTFHLGRTARSLDPHKMRVTDDQGTIYTFEKLLLAIGSTPRRLPFGDEQIIYFRTLDDYQRLRGLCEQGQRFAVIGGGFIASEIAAALSMNGKEVVMIFPSEAIGSHMFPPELANFLNDFYRQKEVEVSVGQVVAGVENRGGKLILQTHGAQSNSEHEFVVDGVVAGIGVEPNVELAATAGVMVENGIRVDSSLRTNLPNIYAAGDVASFHNPVLDKWLRVEHEDNANTMGELAGRAMAGETVSYDYLPSFYSDLFELGYEAVGEVDARLETVVDWKVPYREGVVYYLRDDRVRGVLLWKVWDQVDAARRLIAETGPFKAAQLKGRLPVKE